MFHFNLNISDFLGLHLTKLTVPFIYTPVDATTSHLSENINYSFNFKFHLFFAVPGFCEFHFFFSVGYFVFYSSTGSFSIGNAVGYTFIFNIKSHKP